MPDRLLFYIVNKFVLLFGLSENYYDLLIEFGAHFRSQCEMNQRVAFNYFVVDRGLISKLDVETTDMI